MCSFRISDITDRITSSVAGVVPTRIFNSKKLNRAISWAGEKISSPENRLILGVSALMSQPFIDLSNKRVDEDTRKVSAARTVAKIIAGTTTGVIIRYGCIKAIDYCSKLPQELSKTARFKTLRTLLTPDSAVAGVLKDLTQHKNALGTIISLFVMLFTNFLIDAPATKFLTNKFVDKFHLNERKAPKFPPNPLPALVDSQKQKEVKNA